MAIGRAIVCEPEVFLFDEPLSNLDAALRVDMRQELSKLHGQLGATMIYVTRDQVEAMTLVDKIVVLNGGEVQQVGTPIELYKNPANLFVAGFIGRPKMNFVDAAVKSVEGATLEIAPVDLSAISASIVGHAIKPGDKVTLGIRPHALEMTRGGAIAGEVDLVERLGNGTIVNFRLPVGRPGKQ